MDVSGIVLSGGVSRRLGRDKALELVEGEPLIERVISRLFQVTGQTVVVVSDARQAAELHLPDTVTCVADTYLGAGPLGGIFTGLSACDGDWGMVVACDMPFLNVELLRQMLSLREGYDAVVPVLEGRPEPVHAAYSKACLPYIERRLQANDFKSSGFLYEVRTNYLTQRQLEEKDPEHLSFFNVNTQNDLDRALSLAAQGM